MILMTFWTVADRSYSVLPAEACFTKMGPQGLVCQGAELSHKVLSVLTWYTKQRHLSHSAPHWNAWNWQDRAYIELWIKYYIQKTIFYKCSSFSLPKPLHGWLKTQQNYAMSTIPGNDADFSFWTFCPVLSSTSAWIQPPATLLCL